MKNTEITEHIYSLEGQIYSKKWWFLQFCIQETHYNLLSLKYISSIRSYQLQAPSLIPKNQHYWTIVFVLVFFFFVVRMVCIFIFLHCMVVSLPYFFHSFLSSYSFIMLLEAFYWASNCVRHAEFSSDEKIMKSRLMCPDWFYFQGPETINRMW